MTEPRIVSPQEARVELTFMDARPDLYLPAHRNLANTVATEPDRTRAAVVKALREMADRLRAIADPECGEEVDYSADAIENGADW